jgi:hypothetical protein
MLNILLAPFFNTFEMLRLQKMSYLQMPADDTSLDPAAAAATAADCVTVLTSDASVRRFVKQSLQDYRPTRCLLISVRPAVATYRL